MTNEEFVEICQVCFGTYWIAETVRAIGFSRRHVERLAAGQSPVSPMIAVTIVAVAKQKRDRLSTLIGQQDVEALLLKRRRKKQD